MDGVMNADQKMIRKSRNQLTSDSERVNFSAH